MGKRKYVADELAELLTPGGGAEHDPDALDRLGQGAVLEASDDELQAQAARQPARRRLRGAIDLGTLGARYHGRKTTRAAIFDDGRHEPHMSDEEDASQSMLSDDAEQQDDYDEEDALHNARHTSEDDEQHTSTDDDGGPSPALANGHHSDAEQAAPTDLQAAFASIEADDAAAVSQLSDRAAKERQKGTAVAAQQTLWSRALELRMVLQKGVTAANALPLPDDMAALSAEPGPGLAMHALSDVIQGTLSDLLGLHDALVQQHTAINSAAHAAGVVTATARGGSKNSALSLDAAWEALTRRDALVAPFRDASIDRWHRKVLLASGSMRSGLQALDQSVSQQVQTLMQTPDRLVKRMQLPLSAVKRISVLETAEGPLGEEDAPDPETFDDAELYGALLREFLDSSLVDGATMSALQSRTKKRKQVDRKASKGRKVRYHVHEKLVNFTAPVPLPDTGFAAQLAATLFGGRTTTV